MTEFPTRTEPMTAREFLMAQTSPSIHRVVDLRLQPERKVTCYCGRPFPTMVDMQAHAREMAAMTRSQARERAHQAVKSFDLAPNIQNTTAAIEALAEYEQHLKEENNGG